MLTMLSLIVEEQFSGWLNYSVFRDLNIKIPEIRKFAKFVEKKRSIEEIGRYFQEDWEAMDHLSSSVLYNLWPSALCYLLSSEDDERKLQAIDLVCFHYSYFHGNIIKDIAQDCNFDQCLLSLFVLRQMPMIKEEVWNLAECQRVFLTAMTSKEISQQDQSI